MDDIFHSGKKYTYFLSGLFLLWIILFEFIIPPNNILPKPSIVVLSIISLFRDYQFLVNLLSSISAIYLSAFTAGLFIWLSRRYLINNKNIFGYIAFSLDRISGIIPGILMGLFLIVWLPGSEFSKYIFIFFTCFTYLINKFENELKKVKSEYIAASVSLGAEKNFISDKICWKAIEPALAESMTELHFYIWTMLIVFEMINEGLGMGAVLRTAIQYRDLSGLFASILIICLIIFSGSTLIRFFKNKFIFWSIN
jgi:ABC-type nitrate/sulfonate/bicarbonate transport system permease component